MTISNTVSPLDLLTEQLQRTNPCYALTLNSSAQDQWTIRLKPHLYPALQRQQHQVLFHLTPHRETKLSVHDAAIPGGGFLTQSRYGNFFTAQLHIQQDTLHFEHQGNHAQVSLNGLLHILKNLPTTNQSINWQEIAQYTQTTIRLPYSDLHFEVPATDEYPIYSVIESHHDGAATIAEHLGRAQALAIMNAATKHAVLSGSTKHFGHLQYSVFGPLNCIARCSTLTVEQENA